MKQHIQEQSSDSLIYSIRDYIAGSIGGAASLFSLAPRPPTYIILNTSLFPLPPEGITQVLIGQPFDTIKVRLQAATTRISITECVKDLIRNEGITAFYKGVASPLIFMSGVVSIQFGVFQNTMRKLREWQNISELPIYQISLAGCVSGFACSPIVGPMENIRIKMQVMKTHNYKNTFECAIDVYKKFGLRGIFKGYGATIIREVPGEAVYFMVYEGQMRVLRRYLQDKNPVLLTYAPMVAGGISGLAFWIFVYPIDTIKSRMQSDSQAQPKYNTINETLRKTVKEEGVSALFKGLKVCAIREKMQPEKALIQWKKRQITMEDHCNLLCIHLSPKQFHSNPEQAKNTFIPQNQLRRS